jgi:23S rRNA (cytosine1962-C5)-methyltransferase
LSQFQPGDIVNVFNHRNEALGSAYINPHCLLCVRVFSKQIDQTLNADFIAQRLAQALSLREKLFSQPFYRCCFGESDGLPGLIIDRFDQDFVVQITTAGMERCKTEIIAAIQEVFQPRSILWRNDSSARLQEQLTQEVSAAFGEPPQEVLLIENNAQFYAPIWKGQKTGWFYDHRDNRKRMQEYVVGKKVLDVFSYIGGWGIQAAVAGAEHVTCVDSSAIALNYVKKQAQLNKVLSSVDTLEADAFEALKSLWQQKRFFDVVIVDPPAFIKKRKDLKEGSLAYQRINLLALRLLKEGGFLISSSCSQHLSQEQLLASIQQASVKLNRSLVLTAQGHQGADHPIHPAIPETAYIKALFLADR